MATQSKAGPTEQLVTPREAAGTLSIGLTTLYQLMNDGQLESVRIGRARRVLRSSVDALIERERVR